MSLGFWRIAAVFPVAVPAAHLHAAHLLRLAGWRRAARAVFRRGAEEARKCGMPRERGLLLLGAARTERGARAASLRAGGERVLASMGCATEMF